MALARLAGIGYMDFVGYRSHLHKISVQRYEKKINYTNIFLKIIAIIPLLRRK